MGETLIIENLTMFYRVEWDKLWLEVTPDVTGHAVVWLTLEQIEELRSHLTEVAEMLRSKDG